MQAGISGELNLETSLVKINDAGGLTVVSAVEACVKLATDEWQSVKQETSLNSGGA